MLKPDIVETIGKYIGLRRAGKEFVGLCPFHADRHPSLSVSPALQIFLCRACQATGDVIDFVMRFERSTFKEAIARLGISSTPKRPPRLTARRKRAAELAAQWVNVQCRKIDGLIADRLEQRDLADELDDGELADRLDREVIMLKEFYDALASRQGAVELLAVRASIEKITDGRGAAS